MQYVLLCLRTDATLGLRLGIPVVGHQGLGDAQDPFLLVHFFGGKSVQGTEENVLQLVTPEGSVPHFRSFIFLGFF